MYYGITFKGIALHDPVHAVEIYREKIGQEPTVILVRPEYPVRTEHPLLVRSVAGTAVYMLITHEITMEEVQATEKAWRDKQSQSIRQEFDQYAGYNASYQAELAKAVELEAKGMKKPPLPQKPTCPHCGQTVHDFESLGWWWGWEFGKEPAYWGELRLYVFRRDDYKCFDCGEQHPAFKLNAHHIKRKEDGGIDGARNLRTLCLDCHPDSKPIMSDAPETV